MTTTAVASTAQVAGAAEWLAGHRGRLSLAVAPVSRTQPPEVVALAHREGDVLLLSGGDRALVRKVLVQAFAGDRKVWAHDASPVAWAMRSAYGLRLASLRCALVAARAAWPSLSDHSLSALRPETARVPHRSRLATMRWGDEDLHEHAVRAAAETTLLVADLASVPHREAIEVEVETDRLLRWAGDAGLRVDVDLARQAYASMAERTRTETEFFGFDPAANTSERTAWVLSLGVRLPQTAKGTVSLNKTARAAAVVPPAAAEVWGRMCEAIEATSKRAKVKELLDAVDEDGVVHPRLDVNGAKTGRMSVSGPALQNLAGGAFEPGGFEEDTGLRGLLIASEGMTLVGCDLSHVEPSIVAAASGDPLLREHCSPGRDPYMEAAVAVYGPAAQGDTTVRSRMKKVLLALMYGMGDAALAADLGVSVAEAEKARERVLSVYPMVRRWMAATTEAAERGETPHTLFGRPLRNPKHAYMAVNYVIQGTAADLFKRMLARLAPDLPPGSRLWLPVHDEITVECRTADAGPVYRLMQRHMRAEIEGVSIWGEPSVLGPRWRKPGTREAFECPECEVRVTVREDQYGSFHECLACEWTDCF